MRSRRFRKWCEVFARVHGRRSLLAAPTLHHGFALQSFLKRYGQRERATPAKSCKARRTAAGKRSIEPVRQLSPPEKARSDILLRIADRSKKENQNRRTGKEGFVAKKLLVLTSTA
jgi:hypothetical protein